MNVLLLNLARFGDLLQSQAAIRDLQSCGHRVAVVCLENFRGAAALLSGVSEVFVFPGSGLLAALQADAGSPSGPGRGAGRPWHEGLSLLGVWKRKLEADFAYDAVCNLTPAVAPRLLAAYLAGDKIRTGYFVDAHGFGVDGNAWAAYLKASSGVRGASPFNIVDVFRKSAAFDPALPPQAGNAFLTPPAQPLRERAARDLALAAPEGCAGFVALQLGASRDVRRWPVEFFAALGDRLWEEERLCPVLLGAAAERPLAEKYAAAARAPFADMCGKTGLGDLAALLCACRLLVSNDTGTMHLAAGLDVPVLALFLATAQPFDTGPYREDCLCLEPDMACHPCAFGADCPHGQACRRAIGADFTAELALGYLRRGVWSMPPSGAAGPGGARVWRSCLDGRGFMDLRSLSGHDKGERGVWLRLLREQLGPFLDGESLLRDGASGGPPEYAADAGPSGFLRYAAKDALIDAANDAPKSPSDTSLEASLPDPLRNELRSRLETTVRLAGLLRQQGRVLSGNAPPHMRERFLSNWDKVRVLLGEEERLVSLSLLWSKLTQEADQDFPASLLAVERFGRFAEALARSLS